MPFTRVEAAMRLSYLAGQLLLDRTTVFVGIGAPCVAAMLAKRTHAPHLNLIFESGVMGANPDQPPLSTGSPSVARGASMIGSMLDVFSLLQRGEVDVGLLSGAQVDRHGNLNSTVIGEYATPKVRLPGSGGAHDIAMLAREFVILMPHDPRRFVERVSFITSPGHDPLRGGIAGLGSGPSALVTERAVFGFVKGEMTLTGRYSDVTVEEALDGLTWDVARADEIEQFSPPTQELADQCQDLFTGPD